MVPYVGHDVREHPHGRQLYSYPSARHPRSRRYPVADVVWIVTRPGPCVSVSTSPVTVFHHRRSRLTDSEQPSVRSVSSPGSVGTCSDYEGPLSTLSGWSLKFLNRSHTS